MSTPPDDIDAWLDRREPLFRRSSTAEPLEPPAEIDNVVLARARAALRTERSDEESRPAFFTLRQWVMPLGLAATLVLALAVVVRVGPDAAAPASRAMTESDAASSPAASKSETTAAAAASEPAAPLESAATPVPEVRRQASAMPEREAMAASADLPAPAATLRTAPPPAAPPPSPMPATTMANGAVSAEAMAKSEAGTSANLSAAPRAEDAALQADPERWYQKILALRAQGQTQDADREWRALKARYPDFEAPTGSRN